MCTYVDKPGHHGSAVVAAFVLIGGMLPAKYFIRRLMAVPTVPITPYSSQKQAVWLPPYVGLTKRFAARKRAAYADQLRALWNLNLLVHISNRSVNASRTSNMPCRAIRPRKFGADRICRRTVCRTCFHIRQLTSRRS